MVELELQLGIREKKVSGGDDFDKMLEEVKQRIGRSTSEGAEV